MSIWIAWACQTQMDTVARTMAAGSARSRSRNRAAQARKPNMKAIADRAEGRRRAQAEMPLTKPAPPVIRSKQMAEPFISQ